MAVTTNGRFKHKSRRRVEEKPALPRLDKRQKENMLALAIRNPEVFRSVRSQLTYKLVSEAIGYPQAVVWRAALGYFDSHGTLPVQELLLTETQSLIERMAGQLSDDEVKDAEVFIELAYDSQSFSHKAMDSDVSLANFAMLIFRRLLNEGLMDRMATLGADGTVPDLADTLRAAVVEADRISSFGTSSDTGKLFEGNWGKRELRQPFSTGVSALDAFLGGGHVAPEVNLFMGPMGSCKTTVAVKAVCELAKDAARRTAENPGERWVTVLVSYEADRSEIQDRCLAYLAHIPKDRLIGMDDLSTQLRADDAELEPYEQRWLIRMRRADPNARVPSERERVAEAVELVNKHVIMIDMTSNDPEKGVVGQEGFLEIRRRLQQLQQDEPGLRYLVIWVDHVAAMASRMLGYQDDADWTNLRHVLRNLPDQCRNYITNQFKCPAWLVQQLSGEANSRGTTARFHHTDSDECKSVAMFCDFAVITGPPTEDERQLCVWRCTKHRRQPPHQRLIVKVVGDLNDVKDVSRRYSIDEGSNRLVDKHEEMGYAPPKPQTPARAARAKKKDDGKYSSDRVM